MRKHVCAVGRDIRRPDLRNGLDWTLPCSWPGVQELPLKPPLWFCEDHFEVIAADLEEALAEQIEAMGWIVG